MSEQEEATAEEIEEENVAAEEVTSDEETAPRIEEVGDKDENIDETALADEESEMKEENRSFYKKSPSKIIPSSITPKSELLCRTQTFCGCAMPDELVDINILKRCHEIINEAEKLCIKLGVKAEQEEEEEETYSASKSFEIIQTADSDYSGYDIEELERIKPNERRIT